MEISILLDSSSVLYEKHTWNIVGSHTDLNETTDHRITIQQTTKLDNKINK